MTRLCCASGSTLLEVLFVSALMATLGGIAVPQALVAIDDFRAAGAARYVSGRLQRARMEAVLRSADVALQFVSATDGFRFTVYVDGNRNGVRSRDIQRAIDRALGAAERLSDHFTGVDFGS